MIPHWLRFQSIAAAAGLLLICATRPASALDMPSPFVQEVLIKSILVSLNDAVAADNFTVFHAKISKPFRDQFPPDKLKTIFKDLVDKHAVFDAIVAKPIILDQDAKIDDRGVLQLKGHFDTTPKQVKYQLGFIPSDGAWKLSGISIDIE
ncbi:hypothetical protein MTX26_33945 [Bradyrhizobium sp. ISRA443]|uniref:hypothetical protein n=1 Tax=unclassified Bradyrhizobium TaxID=2631580 RepID=UPI0024785D7A|nr:MULTISPECIES: hypothetical protein [unclassified Bradyrhizobium]WGR99128.1 hypothetical protein MTX23_33925 [Bradyrhizobium sp. ISRA436]WGS06019.1 hypothetical protein MTX18_33945 [Bradyrhizobium sp. ISRA437]WGS12905.1 hypothetical protein MTX26_33945 [Bradyrhizobium sp. ISRA443]